MNRDIESPQASILLEEDTNDLYENAPCGYLSMLPNGTIIKVNTTFLHWTGYSRDALLAGKRFQDLLPVPGRVYHDTHYVPLLLMQGFVKELAFELLRADGQRLPILLNSTLKRDSDGKPSVIRTTLLDARSRRAYEEELRLAKRKAESAEASLKILTENLEERVAERTQERDRIWRISHDALIVASLPGNFLNVNLAFTRILGWAPEEAQRLSFDDLVHPDHLERLRHFSAKLAAGEPVGRCEISCRRNDGSYRWISWAMMPEGELLYAVGRDITEEKEQADALRKTEDALRQSQKMEAVGKLTGGVAHDFNNILQVIASSLELLKLKCLPSDRVDPHLTAAVSAVRRGADLASQLLSFARQQPLRPLPTNLGRVLREQDELLRRALGASIEVETIVSPDLWTALVDRNQLENAILNLAINARDAMRGEGRLTIELGNAAMDDPFAPLYSEVVAGQYVMLAVTDTGSGMSPEVLERAFEPFFTTKGVGEGTGLGLSMVYGFVKQSSGHIRIYSELGIGTTFKIYLPRAQQAEINLVDLRRTPIVGGSETVLVVEDDPAVRSTAVDILTQLGYRVFRAKDGQVALSILESGVPIDMLFTDVVMPGPIKSTALAERAKSLFPDIGILFTSGYTQSTLVHGGRLDPGVELISKPHSRADLAQKIRQVLANRAQSPTVVQNGDLTETL